MAPPTISRIHLTDDTGQGEDGTIIDDALFQTLQDAIDALSAAITVPITANTNAIAAISPASGQIAFPATQNPSTNRNVLDDYKEGVAVNASWTPTDGSGAGLVFNVVSANYIKIGQLVYVDAQLVYPATTNGAAARIAGLPFSAVGRSALSIGQQNTGPAGLQASITGSAAIDFSSVAGGITTNAQMSNINFYFSGCYRATQ
jgi:hypothetical protein